MPVNPPRATEVFIITICPLLLVCFLAVPRRGANRRVDLVARFGILVTALALALSVISATFLVGARSIHQEILSLGMLRVGIYYDALSAVMLILVSFLAVIVIRFARTYLKGDPEQGYFLKWLCITLGGVLTLLVSGNLAQLAIAWIITSTGLHQLLMFNVHRSAAIIAARKKFVVSRMGDIFLVSAIGLIYHVFGTGDLAKLFERVEALRGVSHTPALLTPICLLLVSAAALKSAQFPFHTWLPDTMETPTPVSALMHAGIVNSGGFLIVRLSPLMSLSPLSLNALVVIGAVTAVYGCLAMLTQASIKRMLAYSTIAQMGFMLLECGLGAYSVAVLHIVAHSLYKAHAFLNSGTVGPRTRLAGAAGKSVSIKPLATIGALIAAAVITVAAAQIPGMSQAREPGDFVLNGILLISLVYLLTHIWSGNLSPALVIAGLIAAVGVGLGFGVLHIVCHYLLAGVTQPVPADLVTHTPAVKAFLLCVFAGLVLLQLQISRLSSHPWFLALYVHARNGFYLGTAANRAIRAVWPV